MQIISPCIILRWTELLRTARATATYVTPPGEATPGRRMPRWPTGRTRLSIAYGRISDSDRIPVSRPVRPKNDPPRYRLMARIGGVGAAHHTAVRATGNLGRELLDYVYPVPCRPRLGRVAGPDRDRVVGRPYPLPDQVRWCLQFVATLIHG